VSGRDVFRCDYCGQLTDLGDGKVFGVQTETLDNGDRLHVPAVYCSTYCGRRATTRAGSGRG
jgi:hypothetical protein